MIKFISAAFGVVLVGLISMPSSRVSAYSGEKLAKGAKVSIEQARAIALQTRAGTITDEELEREKRRQRIPLLLRHQERWCRVRSRSGCADGQGSGKQEGGCPSRLIMRRNCGLHGAPKGDGRVQRALPVTLGIPVLLGAEIVCRR